MIQSELEREVAASTGESLVEIRRRGFSMESPAMHWDASEYTSPPQCIDWDTADDSQPRFAALARIKKRKAR